MWVVVGLGNPGRRYDGTRHNVGFAVVDRLADRWGVRVDAPGAPCALRRVSTETPEPVLLVKPQTFMNDAGATVSSLRRFYRVDPSTVVTVHDDLDLPCGRVRLRHDRRRRRSPRDDVRHRTPRKRGDVPRVQVGIGRPPVGVDVAAWVLSSSGRDEEDTVLAAACDRAADGIECLGQRAPKRAMNRINQMGGSAWRIAAMKRWS